MIEQPTVAGQATKSWKDWLGLACRLILGVGLAYAGAIKVGYLAGNVHQVQLYKLPIPSWLEVLIGYTQPFLEILVGLLLITGLFTRVAAALGGLAMIAFIGGISWAWANGLRIDCGCFSAGGELGASEETKYLEDIIRDLGFILTSLWLVIRPKTVFALDSWLFKPIELPIEDELEETESNNVD